MFNVSSLQRGLSIHMGQDEGPYFPDWRNSFGRGQEMPVRGRMLQPATAPHAVYLITQFSVSAVTDQRLKIRTCRAAAQVLQAQGGQTAP